MDKTLDTSVNPADHTAAVRGQDPGHVGVNPADHTTAEHGRDPGLIGVSPVYRVETSTKRLVVSKLQPIGFES